MPCRYGWQCWRIDCWYWHPWDDEEFPDHEDTDSSSVYVSGLPHDIDEPELVRIFSEFGKVESVEIPVDHSTLEVQGYAIVDMASGAQAVDATQELDGATIDGRYIHVILIPPASYDVIGSVGDEAVTDDGYWIDDSEEQEVACSDIEAVDWPSDASDGGYNDTWDWDDTWTDDEEEWSCTSCGQVVDEEWWFCPMCGSDLAAQYANQAEAA